MLINNYKKKIANFRFNLKVEKIVKFQINYKIK